MRTEEKTTKMKFALKETKAGVKFMNLKVPNTDLFKITKSHQGISFLKSKVTI